MSGLLAGKFTTHSSPSYKSRGRRILYIGKATAGAFEEEHASARYFNWNGPFWDFARVISRRADPACEDLSNLVWSNIFKQGVTRGNPSGSIADQQRVDAVAELKKEAEELKPSIIVLVTAGYYEEIPKEAFDITDGEGEPSMLIEAAAEGESRHALWSRPAFQGVPPIVWMHHPQGKSSVYRAAAVNLIVQTAGWSKDRDQR